MRRQNLAIPVADFKNDSWLLHFQATRPLIEGNPFGHDVALSKSLNESEVVLVQTAHMEVEKRDRIVGVNCYHGVAADLRACCHYCIEVGEDRVVERDQIVRAGIRASRKIGDGVLPEAGQEDEGVVTPSPSERVVAARPVRTLLPVVPRRVSLNCEPVRFSKPLSVSVPALIVFWAVVRARLTVTPRPLAPEWHWHRTRCRCRAPPASTLLPALPSSVSSKFEPVRFSMLDSVSPSASPPDPIPRHQAHRNARGRGRIACRVDATATIQRVGTGTPDQDIVAAIAGQHVVESVAGRVDGTRAGQRQVLDAADGVYRIGKAEADRRQNRVGAVATGLVDHVARIVDHIGVVAGAAKHRSAPAPPFSVSVPPRPVRMFAPLLPIRMLSSSLPVPLIAAVPVSVRFSTRQWHAPRRQG